jgi:hypothetical protein
VPDSGLPLRSGISGFTSFALAEKGSNKNNPINNVIKVVDVGSGLFLIFGLKNVIIEAGFVRQQKTSTEEDDRRRRCNTKASQIVNLI